MDLPSILVEQLQAAAFSHDEDSQPYLAQATDELERLGDTLDDR